MLLLATLGQALGADPDNPLERTVDVVVDVRDPASGWLSVTATYHDLSRKELAFRQMGGGSEFTYADVQFEGAQGEIQAQLKDGRIWEMVDPPADGPITVRWRVKPGGMGRHGHQGYVDPQWAAFDGRILLLPRSRYSVRTARFKFTLPAGWSTVHPWVEQDGWLVAHDRAHLKSMVTATCVAVGPFEVRETLVGETPMRVGAFASWDSEHREVLFSKTLGMFQWFHDRLDYDRKHPFTIAWLPNAEGGKQVFGGASVNGACYQHPKERDRNWLLLGHRIGHPYNKYTPSGMSIRDSRDHWFMEGWASYIEVVAAQESGALPDQSYWNTLYSRYLRDLDAHPGWDFALKDEPTSGEAHEFLHYTKGPLVAKLLDVRMRQRSGVGLEDFMKSIRGRYGFHRKVLPLREAIESFTGDSYADFWAAHVDQPGTVYPVWNEVITEEARARSTAEPMAWVGDRPIHPEYIKYLAWRGGFERYADIEAFLVASAQREALLASKGMPLVPESLEAHRFLLPVQAQWAIARTAMDWQEGAIPTRSGCVPRPLSTAPTLRWSESADGQAMTRLLELEAAYEAKRGRKIQGVVIRDPSGKRRLVIGPQQTLSVHTQWNALPPRAGFELGVDGVKTRAKQLTIDPSWTRTHIRFQPSHRPADAHVLTVAIGPDTQPHLAVPIWQTTAPFLKADPQPEPVPESAAQEPR